MTGCVRAGCGRETMALVSFDRDELSVLVRSFDSDDTFALGMCDTHVSRLTVPMGWTLVDERVDQPAEASSLPQPSGKPADPADPRPRSRRSPSPEGGLLTRAFQGPESESPKRRRRSWLEQEQPDSGGEATNKEQAGQDPSSLRVNPDELPFPSVTSGAAQPARSEPAMIAAQDLLPRSPQL